MPDTRAKLTRRANQQELIETRLPEHAAIINLAAQYVEIRDERMVLDKQEIDKREELRIALKDAGLTKIGFHVVEPTLGKIDIDIESVPADEKIKVRIKPIADPDRSDDA